MIDCPVGSARCQRFACVLEDSIDYFANLFRTVMTDVKIKMEILQKL